jgi:hypothetical protein
MDAERRGAKALADLRASRVETTSSCPPRNAMTVPTRDDDRSPAMPAGQVSKPASPLVHCVKAGCSASKRPRAGRIPKRWLCRAHKRKRPMDPLLRESIYRLLDFGYEWPWVVSKAREYLPQLRSNRAMKDAERATARALCDQWAKRPVGTHVWVRDDDGAEYTTVTRSEPWMLGDHAVIKINGIAGGYSLDRLRLREATQ